MSTAKPKSSPARIAANRANARKSTGPKTEAGKARSRANALKHGLTGAGVALPGEDAAAIEAEFLQAQEEFAPTTLAGMRLVRDVAMLWVRQDRAREYETRALAARARRAAIDYDQGRADRADWLLDNIEANPRAYRRALMAMPEGVDRLLEGLTMLLGDMTGVAPTWSHTHHKRLDALFGYRVADLPWTRPTRFSRAALGDFAAIGDAEIADIPPKEQQVWAITQLIETVRAEIARLHDYRATMDLSPIAADRADAIALARLDPGKDGVLAQRYLSAAARDLSRTLRDLHLVESRHGTNEDELEIEPVAEPEPAATPDPIAELNPAPVTENRSDLVAGDEVAPPLASFGEPTPVATPATPVVAPVASTHAPQPARAAVAVAFCPPVRR